MNDTKICSGCGRSFARPESLTPASKKWMSQRYCSRGCINKDRAIMVNLADLLQNHEISDAGCWLWQGYLDRNGYGRVPAGRGRWHAWVHRASYEHFVGPIPDGHHIDHTCCTPPCMNPEHLEPVTPTEHAARTMQRLGKDDLHLLAARMRMIGATYAEIADALKLSSKEGAHEAVKAAIRKGLVAAVDVPPAPRLNDVEREEIRELAALGLTQTLLAQMYKVDHSHISRVCAGLTSGHSKREVAS